MTGPWLERMRDYVGGNLSVDDAAAFLKSCRDDPERMELLEAYELVARAQPAPIAPSTTTFEDLPLDDVPLDDAVAAAQGSSRASPPLAYRWWVAAAVALLAIGWSLWANRDAGLDANETADRAGARPTVTLQALYDDAPVPDRPLADLDVLPDDATEMRTADEHGLVWMALLEDARHIARFSNRRILLFVEYPGCPLCLGFAQDEFQDAEVIRAAAPFVLVRLDWRETPRALRHRPAEGWPLFFVLDPNAQDWDAKPLATLKGNRDAAAMTEFFSANAPAAAPRWDAWTDALQRLRELAADAPLRDRLDALERARTMGGALGDYADHALARAHRDAQTALRGVAQQKDAAGQLEAMRGLMDRYAGTRYAADFAAVTAFLETHGVWPELVAPPGAAQR